MKLHSFSPSLKQFRMCLQRPQKGKAFIHKAQFLKKLESTWNKNFLQTTWQPGPSDHIYTRPLPTKCGPVPGISSTRTKRSYCRLKTLCFKGESKYDCKHKPENSPAASINTLPNTQTFTDKRKPKHQQSKIMQNICTVGKSSTAILPLFSGPW